MTSRRIGPCVAVWAVAVAVGVLPACSTTESPDRLDASDPTGPNGAPPRTTRQQQGGPGQPADPGTLQPRSGPSAPTDESSLPGYFGQPGRGDRLRLLGVREETTTRVSYDAAFRSDRWLVTGVLDVPRGPGPFPAVVLAHGYIEPDHYVSGQSMTRERMLLAERGFVAFHVDYRNHAGSDEDQRLNRNFHLGYSADVLNAVRALRHVDLPVADGQIALMGRSMGGSVVLRALTMAPGLVDAAVVHSSSSSWEPDNYRVWGGRDDSHYGAAARAHGPPNTNPSAWRAVSSRSYFSRITEPVLIQHGALDPECDPGWARATQTNLTDSGVSARLVIYEGEGHTFGVRFGDVMEEAMEFLRGELV